MKALKKHTIVVVVLALTPVLGTLLFGATDVALGQDLAQRIIVAAPPSPCTLAVQSRIGFAEDGTASGGLIAYPQWSPSPCTAPTLHIVSFPESTARCVEFTDSERVIRVSCNFDAGHKETTFSFDSYARY